jgi:hypothetical protein
MPRYLIRFDQVNGSTRPPLEYLTGDVEPEDLRGAVESIVRSRSNAKGVEVFVHPGGLGTLTRGPGYIGGYFTWRVDTPGDSA